MPARALGRGAEARPLLPDASPPNGIANGIANGNGLTDGDAGRGNGHATTRSPPPAPLSTGRAVAVVASTGVLIFLQASNISGMTMTQSAVAADLDAYEDAMWFSATYLIASAAFAPLVGRLATTVFAAAHLTAAAGVCFAVGAVLTARATTLAAFLAGRVVVGLGGAGTMTLSLITVLQLAGRRRRGLFVGLVNAGFTLGLSTGAVVYGALLPVLGWRRLFLVQAPLALLAGLGVLLSMPPALAQDPLRDPSPDRRRRRPPGPEPSVWLKLARIDYAGAVLLTLTIVLLLYGLAGAVRPRALALAPASLLLFVAVEAGRLPRLRDPAATEPILPLELLRSRPVLLSCLAQLGVMAARWSVLYYAPVYVLAVRGRSAATAGAVLLPTNLGFGTGGLVVGWLHIHRPGSFWRPCLVTLLLFAATLALVGQLSRAADTPATAAAVSATNSGPSTLLYVLALVANGFCTGAYLNYTLAHLLHLTRAPTHFIGTSLLATVRGFAGSFGTAIGGGFFMRRLARHLTQGFLALDGSGGDLDGTRRLLVTRLVGSPALVYGPDPRSGQPALDPAERAVAVAGYAAALRELYAAAALLALLMFFAQAGTGWTEPGAVPPDPPTCAVDAEDGENTDDDDDDDEFRHALAEHDPAMEA